MRCRPRTILTSMALLLLAVGCTDEQITAPQQALFSTTAEAVVFDVIALEGLMSGAHGHSRANAIQSHPGGGATIVGAAHLMGDLKAVRWSVAEDGSASAPFKLGEMPEFFSAYPYQSARDVNASGVIVGEALLRVESTIHTYSSVAFVFDGEMKALPWLLNRTQSKFAWEINDAGMVAGWIRYTVRDENDVPIGSETRGALWLAPYEDEPILLAPLQGHLSAQARTINNDGVMAGWSWTGADTTGTYWIADATGAISGPWALAAGFRSTAINATGHIAGHAFDEAAHWDPLSGTLTKLGTLQTKGSSQAFGISDAEGGAFRIVGWSGRGIETGVPTVWTGAGGTIGGPVALGLPDGYTAGYASDVEERGWVVGRGDQKHRNQTISRALIWRPQSGGGGDEGGDGGCKPHPKTGVCR